MRINGIYFRSVVGGKDKNKNHGNSDCEDNCRNPLLFCAPTFTIQVLLDIRCKINATNINRPT